MITLVTGSPGTGKTLYTVEKFILGELEKQSKAVQAGELSFDYCVSEKVVDSSMSLNQDTRVEKVEKVFRSLNIERPIYSNINALNIENVKTIDEDDYDYNKYPEGSVIIYDECQKLPSFASKTRTPDAIVESLQTHRHHGYDIIFITQSPSFINKYVKDVVGHHIHFRSLLKGRQSVGYEWSECQENPSSETSKRLVENKINFFYPKRLFGLYKSTVLDTHKQSILQTIILHKWKIAPIALGALAIAYAGFNVLNSNFFKFGNDTKSEVASQPTPSDLTKPKVTGNASAVAPISPPQAPQQSQQVNAVYNIGDMSEAQYEATRVAIAWDIDGVSMCYNKFGQRLNIDEAQCKLLANNASMFQPSYDRIQSSMTSSAKSKTSSSEETKPQPQADNTGSTQKENSK